MRGTLVLIVAVVTFLFISLFLWRRRTCKVDQIEARVDKYWDSLKERRKFIRFKKCLNVVCNVPEKQGTIYHTFSKDISGEGICLQVQEILPEKTILDLKVELPGSRPISIIGEVAWVNETPNEAMASERLFDTGIKFIKIYPKDKESLGGFLELTIKDQNDKKKEG